MPFELGYEAVEARALGVVNERVHLPSYSQMYNRHGTVHCTDLTVFSPLNAARAISLAASLLLRMAEMDADEVDELDDDSM